MSQLLSDLATFKSLYPYEIIKKHGDTKAPSCVEIRRPSGVYLFCSVELEGVRGEMFRVDPRARRVSKVWKLVFCHKGVFRMSPNYPVIRLDETKRLNLLDSEKMLMGTETIKAIVSQFTAELI